MAAEIKALEGDGEGVYRVLFLYPISTPETYTDGAGAVQTVVPTPAPTEGVVSDLLSTAERNALDAGDAAYEVVTYGPSPGKTTQQMVADLQALYTQKLADFQVRYAHRYKYLGAEVDAP